MMNQAWIWWIFNDDTQVSRVGTVVGDGMTMHVGKYSYNGDFDPVSSIGNERHNSDSWGTSRISKTGSERPISTIDRLHILGKIG